MKRKLLSPEQAYRAMFAFLEAYYERTRGKAELGEVLGDMQISEQGASMDPAAWDDWLTAIEKVCEKGGAR